VSLLARVTKKFHTDDLEGTRMWNRLYSREQRVALKTTFAVDAEME